MRLVYNIWLKITNTERAFEECTTLKSITIPNRVKYIELWEYAEEYSDPEFHIYNPVPIDISVNAYIAPKLGWIQRNDNRV